MIGYLYGLDTSFAADADGSWNRVSDESRESAARRPAAGGGVL
jgi:hypothetical protein